MAPTPTVQCDFFEPPPAGIEPFAEGFARLMEPVAPDACLKVRDDHLIRLLANARRAWQQLKDGQASGPERRQLLRAARLTFLAPDITMAILEGRQPVELTARSLLRVADLSHDWREQLRVLGFKAI